MSSPKKSDGPEKIKIVDQINVKIISDKEIACNKEPLRVDIQNKKESKWRDPSAYIALLTLLALCFSWYSLHVTDSQWEAINSARISVNHAQFLTVRTIDLDNKYRDSIEGILNPQEDLYNPNYMLVKYLIGARHPKDTTYIAGTLGLTKYQCQQEVIRRQITNYNDLVYERWYRPQVTIQNVGQTSCTIDSIIIRNYVEHANSWVKGVTNSRVPAADADFTLEPNEKYLFNYMLVGFPLYGDIPDFDFDLYVYFKNIKNVSSTKKVTVKLVARDFHISN